MKKWINFLLFQLIIPALLLSIGIASRTGLAWDMAVDVPEEVPGDFKGKWYGVHCPYVKREMMLGERGGDAYPNQKVINAWGYKANPIEEIKDLLPEQYYLICSHPQVWGNMRINETAYIDLDEWPGLHQKLRKKATEKYKGQPYVDEKGHIRNYKAGFPFPGSTKGIELAWNFINARNYGEALFCQFYSAVTDRKGHTRYCLSDQNYFWWNGKLYGENKPLYKPNPNNYDFFNALGFREPYDLRGTISLTHRYDDPDTQDDMWMYIPVLRRVRRMSTAQRWDKFPGGQDLTWDSVTGFQGKPSNYEWKYLGRKLLLCGHNSTDRLMEIKGKPGGSCNQTYQRVNTVLLQYIPKIVSSVERAVMYLDPDTYCCYYVDFFDKRGRPYLFYAHQWVVRKDGCIGLMGFLVADVQRVHSSNIYTFNSFQNTDAIAEGRNPEYFQMQNLRKVFPSR